MFWDFRKLHLPYTLRIWLTKIPSICYNVRTAQEYYNIERACDYPYRFMRVPDCLGSDIFFTEDEKDHMVRTFDMYGIETMSIGFHNRYDVLCKRTLVEHEEYDEIMFVLSLLIGELQLDMDD